MNIQAFCLPWALIDEIDEVFCSIKMWPAWKMDLYHLREEKIWFQTCKAGQDGVAARSPFP